MSKKEQCSVTSFSLRIKMKMHVFFFAALLSLMVACPAAERKGGKTLSGIASVLIRSKTLTPYYFDTVERLVGFVPRLHHPSPAHRTFWFATSCGFDVEQVRSQWQAQTTMAAIQRHTQISIVSRSEQWRRVQTRKLRLMAFSTQEGLRTCCTLVWEKQSATSL
jgi:hypothetical protein